jgi:hypothetical protein
MQHAVKTQCSVLSKGNPACCQGAGSPEDGDEVGGGDDARHAAADRVPQRRRGRALEPYKRRAELKAVKYAKIKDARAWPGGRGNGRFHVWPVSTLSSWAEPQPPTRPDHSTRTHTRIHIARAYTKRARAPARAVRGRLAVRAGPRRAPPPGDTTRTRSYTRHAHAQTHDTHAHLAATQQRSRHWVHRFAGGAPLTRAPCRSPLVNKHSIAPQGTLTKQTLHSGIQVFSQMITR